MLPVLAYHSLGDTTAGSSADNGGSTDAQGTSQLSNKKTAMVASAAALGAILLGVGGFFGSRYALRKRSEYKSSQQSDSTTRAAGSSMQEGSQGVRPMNDLSNYSPTSTSESRSRYPGNEGYPYIASAHPAGPNNAGEAPAAKSETPRNGDDERMLFDYRSPPLTQASTPPSVRASQVHYPDQSYLNTIRSASGSSVQSELLPKRFSSVDFENPHGDWWMRKSQWDGVGLPQPVPPVVQEHDQLLRPYSANADSVYSTNVRRHSSDGRWDNSARPLAQHVQRQSRSINTRDISAPYLQDNSLML